MSGRAATSREYILGREIGSEMKGRGGGGGGANSCTHQLGKLRPIEDSDHACLVAVKGIVRNFGAATTSRSYNLQALASPETVVQTTSASLDQCPLYAYPQLQQSARLLELQSRICLVSKRTKTQGSHCRFWIRRAPYQFRFSQSRYPADLISVKAKTILKDRSTRGCTSVQSQLYRDRLPYNSL